MDYFASFYGYQLIGSPCMADKVQARIHKKKRINKKWKKRYGTKDVPWKNFVINTNDGVIYGHPKMLDALVTEAKLKGCF